MQNSQNFKRAALVPVYRQIRGFADDQLSRPGLPAWAATIWKVCKTRNSCQDDLHLLSGGGWFVAGNIAPQRLQITNCWRRPYQLHPGMGSSSV